MEPLQEHDPVQLGAYRLTGRLGSGGMGRVFLGRSPSGRSVALKVIRPDLAEDPDFRRRFAREVAVARRVGGFYTAPVVDADTEGPMPWLATAYIAGPSLADVVREHGPLPERSLRALAAGLAEALQSIHASGTIHRDLKPSNVLLALDGPRVIDFGIARAADDTSVTATDLVVGSPGYLSPEQARGEEVAPASDVFSLGSVLVFAATGNGPFGGGSAPGLLYRVVHADPVLDGVPASLHALIADCLTKDEVSRPTTDQVLHRALPQAGQTGELSLDNWLPDPLARQIAAQSGDPSALPGTPQQGCPGAPAGIPAAGAEGTDAAGPGIPGPPGSGHVPGPYGPPYGPPPRYPRQLPAGAAPQGAPVPPRPLAPPAVPAHAPGAAHASGGAHAPVPAGMPPPVPRPDYAPGFAPPKPESPPNRRRFIALGAAAATAAVGGVAAWLFGRDGDPAAKPPTGPSGPTGSQPAAAQVPAQVPRAPTGSYTLAMWCTEFGSDNNTAQRALLTELGIGFSEKQPQATVKPTVVTFAEDRKLATALAAGSPPDVFEVEVSELARYHARGQLADLSAYRGLFDVDSWTLAMRKACEIDGQLVAVPQNAALSVVLYRKDLCDPAGFTVPRTQDAWLAELARLKAFHAGNPKFQAVHMPGQAWQVIASSIWAAGGRIAEKEGTTWRGRLDQPAAQAGMGYFKKLQAFSTAPKNVGDYTADTGSPYDVLGAGDTAMIVGGDWIYDPLIAAHPDLKGKLGVFPLPSPVADRPAPVPLVGTVLVVAKASRLVSGAARLLAMTTTADWQSKWSDASQSMPARTGVVPKRAADNPMLTTAQDIATEAARMLPQAPGFAIAPLRTYATEILNEMNPATAGQKANGVVDATYNNPVT
ncbi:serine/threonine-protein kinase (plasmid) [Embleya sp. NBC_00888]|uniref:serine/threonine-protein kinase n=1 Tax=Embleya sp. NBC_00888 TaxID=2975960 RepID=UPI002F9110AF|nr:serine/threonine-protein kinase [Embleya sp. NBC_00888]